MSDVDPRRPEWRRSLPRLSAAREEESLLSLCLRLDEDNDLPAGHVLRAASRYATGISQLASPGTVLLAGAFDLERLARISALDIRTLEPLTARPLTRGLFGIAGVKSRTLGQRRRWAVCPRCVASREIRLAHLLAVASCQTHGVYLIERCRCGAPVSPVRGQRPFHCHACGFPYSRLLTRVVPARARPSAASRATIVSAFLRTSLPATSASILREALRSMLALSERPVRTDMRERLYGRLGRGVPSLRLVIEVAGATGASVHDFATLLGELAELRRTARGDSTGCPNPSCDRRGKATSARGSVLACTACGTRYTTARILFSFDEQPGYSLWRARRNRRRLSVLRERVCSVLDARPVGLRASVAHVLAAAGVPASPSYLSRRAGLVTLVRAANRSAEGFSRDARRRRVMVLRPAA